MRSWFPDDRACLDYLDWLRWPEGFRCPLCAGEQAWKLPDGQWSCGRCGRRVSPTAGTIFHGTRTPLTVWFAAVWQMTSQKRGISALGLKRVLGIGSEQTARAMLHRHRTAMVRPGRDSLSKIVEVDETFIGGAQPGRPRRGALGKTMVVIAVEQDSEGRLVAVGCRSSRTRAPPRCDRPCSTTCSPGRSPSPTGGRATRRRAGMSTPTSPSRSAPSGLHAHELLPGVHRVASLVQRWLLSTHQGGVKPGHLQAYLDEFAFRFNRRRSRARGMLFYRLLEHSVQAPPRTYRSLVTGPASGRDGPPPPPPHKHVRPASLARRAPRPPVAPPVKPAKPINPHRLH
jgi:hypothetical protein